MSVSAQQTIDRLKHEMKTKGDFPAVSTTLERILRSMKDESCSDEQMAALVLGDFALTQKVLRLANSAMYSTFGQVTTVSKAIYVLGTDTVGHVAMGMKLLDNLGQAADTRLAKQELSKTVVAGAIARNVGSAVSNKDGEPLAVATLIRSLGKLLVCFYLPGEFSKIEAEHPSFETEGEVSKAVLGLGYDELALAVVEEWKLPPELKASASEPYNTTDSHTNWLHAVTGYALRYITSVSEGGSQDELERLAERHAEAIGVAPADLLTQAQAAVNIALEEAEGEVPAFMAPAERAKDRNVEPSRARLLLEGIAEIEAAKSTMKPGQILGMATEVLWKGLGCSRFMLFLRNRQAASFDLVLGRGEGVAEQIRKLRFPEAFSPNVFHFALAKDTPIYLNDAFEPSIAKRIPQWLHEVVPPARSIFLLPFSVNLQPTGIIYLDWDKRTRKTLTKEEQELIEKLHDVVGAALEQAAQPKK